MKHEGQRHVKCRGILYADLKKGKQYAKRTGDIENNSCQWVIFNGATACAASSTLHMPLKLVRCQHNPS